MTIAGRSVLRTVLVREQRHPLLHAAGPGADLPGDGTMICDAIFRHSYEMADIRTGYRSHTKR